MNFTERLLSMGYEREVPKFEKRGRQVEFNPISGWLGLTRYHPKEKFIKGNNVVELDLSRHGVNEVVYNCNGRKEIKVEEKSIKLTIEGEVVYHNLYGVIPDDKIIALL